MVAFLNEVVGCLPHQNFPSSQTSIWITLELLLIRHKLSSTSSVSSRWYAGLCATTLCPPSEEATDEASDVELESLELSSPLLSNIVAYAS